MCESVCICVCLCMYVGAEMTRLQVLDGYTTTKSLYRDLSRAGPCMGTPIVEICSILKYFEAYMCRKFELRFHQVSVWRPL